MIHVQTMDGGIHAVSLSKTIPLYEHIRQWNPELFHPVFQRVVCLHRNAEEEQTVYAPFWMDDDAWPFYENESVLLVMSIDIDVSVKIHSSDHGLWLIDLSFSPRPLPGAEPMMERFLSFWYEPQYSLPWSADYGMYATLSELLQDHLPRLCDFPRIQQERVMAETEAQIKNHFIQTK